MVKSVDLVETCTGEHELECNKNHVIQIYTICEKKESAECKDPILFGFLLYKDTPGDEEESETS